MSIKRHHNDGALEKMYDKIIEPSIQFHGVNITDDEISQLNV